MQPRLFHPAGERVRPHRRAGEGGLVRPERGATSVLVELVSEAFHIPYFCARGISISVGMVYGVEVIVVTERSLWVHPVLTRARVYHSAPIYKGFFQYNINVQMFLVFRDRTV